jgi:hypothetical protein
MSQLLDAVRNYLNPVVGSGYEDDPPRDLPRGVVSDDVKKLMKLKGAHSLLPGMDGKYYFFTPSGEKATIALPRGNERSY